MNNTYFQNAKFTGSYPTIEDLPVDEGSEIAFCGRSNCGKSSILNAITNNKKFHNFFNGGEQARVHLVACVLEDPFN